MKKVTQTHPWLCHCLSCFNCSFLSILILLNICIAHLISTHVDASYNDDSLAIEPSLYFKYPRLRNAYIALQAWKEAMASDPTSITLSWTGPNVCNYTGVFCWKAPDDPTELAVAGIDMNHCDISGNLVHELGLLYDLTFFHINSNRFCGTIPQSLVNLKILFELDLSNNRFAGKFPQQILQLPGLKYLDIRFNEFEGTLPKQLFQRDFDAVLINDNRFDSELPNSISNSKVSVLVLANNKFQGCVPPLGKMASTLHELILTGNKLHSCFPSDIGMLKNLTVLDLSYNQFVGRFPNEILEDMVSLEVLNLAHNMMSGEITDKVCLLPKLKTFLYDHNFFTNATTACFSLPQSDDGKNCLQGKPNQRSTQQCKMLLSKEVQCSSFHCTSTISHLTSPLPPPSPIPSTPPPNNPPPCSCSCNQIFPPPPLSSSNASSPPQLTGHHH